MSNVLKKKVKEFGQQRKNLDNENRRLEHLAEILKDLREFIFVLFFLKCNYKENRSGYPAVLSNSANKDIERSESGGVKVRLTQEVLVI